MITKMERRIKKIKRILETKDYEYEDLFESEEGKILASHIKETEVFCQKYFLIPMLGQFQQIIYKILSWTDSEEYKEMMKDKIETEEEKEMFELFQEFQKKSPNWMEETGLGEFTNEEEQIRFFTYLTITIVSCFEIYAKNSINQIQDNLIDNSDFYTKKYGIKIRDILRGLNKKERNNAKLQIDNVIKSLNIQRSFFDLLSKYDFGDYPKIAESIIELRNEIIHRKPFPDLSILDLPKIKSLEEYISTNLCDMDMDFVEGDDEFKKSTIAKTVFEDLTKMFKPKIKLISLLQKLPEIINLYASLFDNLVDLYFPN